jgi:hypothetical protein
LVLAYYFAHDVYKDGKIIGSAYSNNDSCKYFCQETDERLLIFDICSNSVTLLSPSKEKINKSWVDSITIFSNKEKEIKHFTKYQVEKFVDDWNRSKPRGYSPDPFDSAFSGSPPFQYKIEIFSKGSIKVFYGYNFIVLDSSNWKYIINKHEKLDYFHSYWADAY